MIKKISFSVVLLTSLLFINTSCEDYLDVNKNVDAPALRRRLSLPGRDNRTRYQGMYYDMRATGPLTQMMGTSSYTSFRTDITTL